MIRSTNGEIWLCPKCKTPLEIKIKERHPLFGFIPQGRREVIVCPHNNSHYESEFGEHVDQHG